MTLLLLLAVSVSAHQVPFKKKVDPSKLHRELRAAGCDLHGVMSLGARQWVELNGENAACSAAKVLSLVDAHDPKPAPKPKKPAVQAAPK